MEKKFSGGVLFLDRSDINTDEIIPAKYLTENSKEALGPHLLEDLKLEGFQAEHAIKGKKIIITRENFGCGSSREHAPWALEVNEIRLVIAANFARIFKQNMFNCGLLAVELPESEIEQLFSEFYGKGVFIETDFNHSVFKITADGKQREIAFTISDFDRALVETGGWVEYADKKY
ncbi:3-isopropylmalate dehydratase small subunit [Desulfococcaceae bacterium HSG7]|nr:3-isopropylmalate dehydratase small subunit [Desulfococcaceae bacterium HSG7]